jgi:putative membrane protein
MTHYGYGNGDHWGAWLLMFVVLLMFLGALAWTIFTLLRQRGIHPHSHTHLEDQPDALRILDQRLARGEIEEEEYKRRRDLLRRTGR